MAESEDAAPLEENSVRDRMDAYKKKLNIVQDKRLAQLIGMDYQWFATIVRNRLPTKPKEIIWILLDILADNPGILEELKIKRLAASRTEDGPRKYTKRKPVTNLYRKRIAWE